MLLSLSSTITPACPHCQRTNLTRLMSRFSAPKSEEARLDALADPTRLGDFNEDDPSSVARLMKKMGEEMGEDFGDDIEEAIEDASEAEADANGPDMN